MTQVCGNARGAKIRSILSSIIQSETIYVECLNKMMQVSELEIEDNSNVLKCTEAMLILGKNTFGPSSQIQPSISDSNGSLCF